MPGVLLVPEYEKAQESIIWNLPCPRLWAVNNNQNTGRDCVREDVMYGANFDLLLQGVSPSFSLLFLFPDFLIFITWKMCPDQKGSEV